MQAESTRSVGVGMVREVLNVGVYVQCEIYVRFSVKQEGYGRAGGLQHYEEAVGLQKLDAIESDLNTHE